MRVAIYARVSTEEQAKHGLSIDTQLDNLRNWATANGHTVIDEYVDAGISARKNPARRPALQRLLADLGKIDAVVFTKLDRWTRNIKGYYQIQEQLDAHHVAWIATQEDYETVTASGRFKVNIMLSVAENEADRTSERIKVVFDRKISRGEYIGNRVPLGYSVIGKHLVPNEDAEAVRLAFAKYRETGSIYQVKELLFDLGYNMVYVTVCRILRNGMYAGRYRDNDQYCEAIIDPNEFDEVQAMLERRSYRQNQSKRIYLFSGLIRCGCCGKVMVGSWAGHTTETYRYRCNYHALNGRCPNGNNVAETMVEEYLLSNLVTKFTALDANAQTQKKKKPVDRSAITQKMNRLKDLYVDGLIDKETYLADREKLMAKLPDSGEKHRDLSAVREIVLRSDFMGHYRSLSREEKRALWRVVVDHMTIDAEKKIDVYFLP